MKRWVTVLVIGLTVYFCLFHIQTIQPEPQSILLDYRLFLGSKAPYAPYITSPNQTKHTPRQVHLISRHGARYWTRKKHQDMFTVAKYLHGVDPVRHPQLANLTIPFPKDSAGELTPIGKRSMFRMGKRWAHRYPSLLNGPIYVYSSSSQRVIDSMESFVDGLGYPVIKHIIQNRTIDADLNPELSCSKFLKWTKTSPAKNEGRLWMNQYSVETTARFNQVVGIPLDNNQVKTIIEMCAAQISLLGYGRNDGVCYLLTDRDFENYEILDDVSKYHALSYGNAFNPMISCSLITSLIKDISKHEQMVTMRFTHAETLIPLVTAFGMFKDDHDISGSMKYEQLLNRKFHTSRLSPFQGNLIFEVYDCLEGLCIRVYLNERHVHFPGCGKECSLKLFQQLLSGYIGCNFDEICENPYHTTGGWNQ